ASFLAVLHAEKYREQIYNTVKPLSPLKFRELKLTRATKVKKLLELTGLSKEGLHKYNLDIKDSAFRRNLTIPKGYIVHIPDTIVTEFLTKKQKYGKLLDIADSANSL